MAELTREQLEAMGLNEEQINAVLGVIYGSNTIQMPFPIAKVNYDSELAPVGVWAINPVKDDEGNVVSYDKVLSNPVKMRFLKSLFQYSKFDADLGKKVVTSNIFEMRNIANAYDLKTGVAIVQLKEEQEGIKLQRISLIEFIDDSGDKFYAIAYIKGAYLFNLNNIIQKYSGEGHLSKIFTIKNVKEKKGAVIYFVPELVEVEDYDIMQSIKEDAEKINKFIKWAKDYNNLYNKLRSEQIGAGSIESEATVESGDNIDLNVEVDEIF